MQPPEYFFIRENRGYVRVDLASVIYMEAQKNYVRIVTIERSHLVASTLTAMEQLVAGGTIVRVHRSFLINIAHLSGFDSQKVMMSETRIPVTQLYYKSLEEAVIVVGKQKPRLKKKQVTRTAQSLIV